MPANGRTSFLANGWINQQNRLLELVLRRSEASTVSDVDSNAIPDGPH